MTAGEEQMSPDGAVGPPQLPVSPGRLQLDPDTLWGLLAPPPAPPSGPSPRLTAQLCEHTVNHRTAYFKWVNRMASKAYR